MMIDNSPVNTGLTSLLQWLWCGTSRTLISNVLWPTKISSTLEAKADGIYRHLMSEIAPDLGVSQALEPSYDISVEPIGHLAAGHFKASVRILQPIHMWKRFFFEGDIGHYIFVRDIPRAYRSNIRNTPFSPPV